MADTEAMKQVIVRAAIEAAKAALLAINEEGRKQSMIAVYSSASKNTRQRIEPCLRQPVFNWNAKDKHNKPKNFEME